MAYATLSDITARTTRSFSSSERTVCEALLEDAAILIDNFNADADEDVKLVVSCRMVVRALGDGGATGVPVGASQGSIAALGYSQSWTMSSGSAGELYLSKLEKKLLGKGYSIGSYSPVEELVVEEDDD